VQAAEVVVPTGRSGGAGTSTRWDIRCQPGPTGRYLPSPKVRLVWSPTLRSPPVLRLQGASGPFGHL